jgi:hypothetical protein
VKIIDANPRITKSNTMFAPIITPKTKCIPFLKPWLIPELIIISIPGPGASISKITAVINDNILYVF